MARPRTTGTRAKKPDTPPQEETLDQAPNGADSPPAAQEEPAATDPPEAEVVDADAVEVDPEEQPAPDEPLPVEASKALARIEEQQALPPAVAHTMPNPVEWQGMRALAREIAATEFVPKTFRGRPEAVLACIMAGREMSLGPMQALRQIHIIDGRPAFAADLMLGKMREGGVQILASAATAERAYIKAVRKDTGEEAEVEWTIEEAKTAGLLGKNNWKHYPADMLWARCVGRLARRIGSDLLGGNVYSAEEVRDFDDGGSDYDQPTSYDTPVGETEFFDPEVDLLPGSIPLDDEYWQRIKQQCDWIDAQLAWSEIFSQAARHVWSEVTEWKALKGEDYKGFATRLSNAFTKITELAQGAEIVEDAAITEAFAFAFEGVTIDLGRGAPAAATEDVPESESAEDLPVCKLCGKEIGDVAVEMSDPSDPGNVGIVHEECGNDAGWNYTSEEDVPFGS